jgi:hypothetical protein
VDLEERERRDKSRLYERKEKGKEYPISKDEGKTLPRVGRNDKVG